MDDDDDVSAYTDPSGRLNTKEHWYTSHSIIMGVYI